MSCLNALNALFAKLVAVVIVDRERREAKGDEIAEGNLTRPGTDKESGTATVVVRNHSLRMSVDPFK